MAADALPERADNVLLQTFRTGHAVRELLEHAVAGTGVSADEWAVLSAVGLFRSVAPTRLATVLRVPPTRAALRARLRSGECLGRPVRYTHGRAGSSEDREGQVDRHRRYAVGRRLPRRELVGHELQRRRDRPGGSVHEPCSRSHRDRWHAGEPDGRLRLSVGGSATGTAVFRIRTETTRSRESRREARDRARSSPSGTRSGSPSRGATPS
jgi:hypothetical protein